MSKSSGLGDALYVGGNDLSGDTQSLGKISGSMSPIDVTPINLLANQRIGGQRDGDIEWTAFWNSLGAHPVLSALPTTDTQVMYCRGTTLGSPAASMNALQINYDPTRAANGELTMAVQAQADGFGLEWGQLLTAGVRTDTAATAGASIDTTASAAFGAQAYLQVMGFTGTDCTVKIQDSADNATFADVASLVFAQTVAAPTFQRIAIGNTATVRRYLRATTVTTGGFTSCAFAVAIVKNLTAGQVF